MANPLQKAFPEIQGWLDPGDALGMQREREAQEQLQQRFKEMEQKYAQYRPEAAQSRMNALNQQLGAFGPINDLLERMYGPGNKFDLAALGQNPMTPGMMNAATLPEGFGEKPGGDAGFSLDELFQDVFGNAGSAASAAPGFFLNPAASFANALPGPWGDYLSKILGPENVAADALQGTRDKPLAAGVPGSTYGTGNANYAAGVTDGDPAQPNTTSGYFPEIKDQSRR